MQSTPALKSLSALMLFCLTFMVCGLHNGLAQKLKDAMPILESYAKDYELDPTFDRDVTFGIQVDNDFYTITAKSAKDAPGTVTVKAGKPTTPTFYFVTSLETLNQVDRGEMNALTGAAKAFSSDYAPFDADVMEGFVPDETFTDTLFKVYFHFWTRGLPERIPYGLDKTRFTHGAQASIFYYQEGFRSGYIALKQGQHANQDEGSKSNPFPTLLVIIKGTGTMIIAGKESELSAGEAILIPAGITHEFINHNPEPLEAILLMFGDGA